MQIDILESLVESVVVNRKNHGYGLAADIWSLGCTVLEMLTQKIPYSQFEGELMSMYVPGLMTDASIV
ncbi:hypothetical protein CsSME_00010129 [Camellia sinensis var. sinensis]